MGGGEARAEARWKSRWDARHQNFVALGDQAWRERRNITNGGHRKHCLEGHGIGALVENNTAAVMDKEGPRRCKITDLEVSKWIVEELVRS